MRLSITLIVLAALCATVARAQSTAPADPNLPETGSARSPLKLTLKMDKGAYSVGEVVHFTLIIKNPTKKPVAITFATGQKYDLFLLRPAVEKKPAEIVWQWSLGMMFTQMVTTTTFAPGQTVQYEVKYPPDDGTKPPTLTKGVYTVKATLTEMGRGPKPETVAKLKVK